jgi:ATP:corrinoid adenosyltransferase
MRETLINAYVAKSGKSREVVAADMDEEKWFKTAQSAKDYGLVDEITPALRMAASISQEVVKALGYKNAPTEIVASATPTPSAPLSVTPRSLLERKLALLEKVNKH